MKRVFVIGDEHGAYRNKYVIEILKEKYNIWVSNIDTKKKHKKLFHKFLSLTRLIKSDIVFVCACKQNSPFVMLSTILRKKMITDYYISFYDTDVLDRKKYQVGSKRAKKSMKDDYIALTKSEKVLFLNKAEANYYSRLANVKLSDINYEIVPLCIPQKPEAELNYFKGNRSYITFCWCGTYIPLQGLDRIIKAAALALSKGLNMKLVIWGDSEEKCLEYINLAAQLGISEHVEFINKWSAMDEWTNYIVHNCDVTLGIFGESDKAKTVLANKVVDGVAFKTPVITGKSKGVNEYFENTIFQCDNTPEDLAQIMIDVSELKIEDVRRVINLSYGIYAQHFTPTFFKKSVINILEGK